MLYYSNFNLLQDHFKSFLLSVQNYPSLPLATQKETKATVAAEGQKRQNTTAAAAYLT